MFFRSLTTLWFLALTAAYPTLAQEPNGAVPGLMPSLSELQSSSRLEFKTLVQFADILELEATRAQRRGQFQLGGRAEGIILLGGTKGDNGSFKFQGLDRETTPIKTHLDRLVPRVLIDDSITDAQRKGLATWKTQVDIAFARCDQEPTLKNLRAAAMSLAAITEALAAFKDADVAFLEAGFDAWSLGYAAYVAQGEMESSTADDKKALMGAMEARYGVWISRIQGRLQTAGGNIAELIATGDKLKRELNQGTADSLFQITEWSNDVYLALFAEEKAAPVMLRHSQMILMGSLANRLTKMWRVVGESRKNGANGATFDEGAGGFKAEVSDVYEKPTVRFLNGDDAGFYLEQTRRLAQQTLKQTKLLPPDRTKLEAAIAAMTEAEKGMGQATKFETWSTWLQAIQAITELYRF